MLNPGHLEKLKFVRDINYHMGLGGLGGLDNWTFCSCSYNSLVHWSLVKVFTPSDTLDCQVGAGSGSDRVEC